jgi:hypothetical protein
MSQASCSINSAVMYRAGAIDVCLLLLLILHEMRIITSVHVLYLCKNDSARQVSRVLSAGM